MRAIRSRIPAVEVGVLPESPAAEAAYFAEFGTVNEPPRPILRGWFDTIGRAVGRRVEESAARDVLLGNATPAQAADQIGTTLAESMRQHVAAGIPPALDENTRDPERAPFAGTSIPDSIGFKRSDT